MARKPPQITVLQRFLAETDQGWLVGGLQWRPIEGAPSAGKLRRERGLTEASHYALCRTADKKLTAYGLFALRPSEEGARLPKQMLAAAVAFANLVGSDYPNAALCVQVPPLPGDHEAEARHYVVTLANGLPVMDTITNTLGRRNAVGADRDVVFTDDTSTWPRGVQVDLAWLLTGLTKDTRIAAIPINPIPAIAAVLVVTAAATGYLVHYKHKKDLAARQAAEAMAAADPVPKYLTALAMQGPRMAAVPEQWLPVVDQMMALPTLVRGWSLSQIECAAESQVCAVHWKRVGGTYRNLTDAFPAQALRYIVEPSGKVPQLDDAVMTFPIKIDRRSLQAPGHELPAVDALPRLLGPQMQVWKTAALSVGFKPPVLWPAVPEVPATFTHPSAVRRGEFNAADLPGPFVREAILTMPATISIETLRATVTIGGEPKARLKFQILGNYYVSAQQQPGA